MSKLVYTVEEAATLIGVSRSFLYNIWNKGEGPAKTKIGGKVFVTHLAIEAWIRAIDGKTVKSSAYIEPMTAVMKTKPAKLKLGSHFTCTEKEMNTLVLEDGEEAFRARVEAMNDWCAQNKKNTYTNYAAAYRNWRRRDGAGAKPKLHLHLHRQETNVDRAKQEGVYVGPARDESTNVLFGGRVPEVQGNGRAHPKLESRPTRLLFFDDPDGDR